MEHSARQAELGVGWPVGSGGIRGDGGGGIKDTLGAPATHSSFPSCDFLGCVLVLASTLWSQAPVATERGVHRNCKHPRLTFPSPSSLYFLPRRPTMMGRPSAACDLAFRASTRLDVVHPLGLRSRCPAGAYGVSVGVYLVRLVRLARLAHLAHHGLTERGNVSEAQRQRTNGELARLAG